MRLKEARRYAESIQELELFVQTSPDVLSFQGELGFCYAQIGDWSNAYRWLKPVVDENMMDSTSLVTYGQAALNLDKLDEAYRVLRKALRRHPGYENLIKFSLGAVCYSKALEHAQANRATPAERQLVEATEWLNFTSSASENEVETQRRIGLAFATVLKAQLTLARGEKELAIKLYREAIRLAPDLPDAAKWQQSVKQLLH